MELLVLGAPPLPLSPTGNKRTFKVKILLKLVKCCVPVVSRNANCPTNFKHSLKHKLLIVLARKQISSKNCCHFHSDSVPVGMPCVFQECWINQGVLVVTASVWPFTVPLHLALPFSLFGQALFLHFYSPSFFDDEVIQSRRWQCHVWLKSVKASITFVPCHNVNFPKPYLACLAKSQSHWAVKALLDVLKPDQATFANKPWEAKSWQQPFWCNTRQSLGNIRQSPPSLFSLPKTYSSPSALEWGVFCERISGSPAGGWSMYSQCIHGFRELCISVNLEFTVCAQHPELSKWPTISQCHLFLNSCTKRDASLSQQGLLKIWDIFVTFTFFKALTSSLEYDCHRPGLSNLLSCVTLVFGLNSDWFSSFPDWFSSFPLRVFNLSLCCTLSAVAAWSI